MSARGVLLRPTPVRSRPQIAIEQGVERYLERERTKRLSAALAELRGRQHVDDLELDQAHVLSLLENWREAQAAGVIFGACSVSFEGRAWLVG